MIQRSPRHARKLMQCKDDNFEDCVQKIVTELCPQNPKNKKQNNENLNVEEFNRLNLSNNESDSKEEEEE